MRQRRLALVSSIMILAVAAFGLFWTVEYTLRIYQWVFVRDWSDWPIIDADLEITTAMRWSVVPLYIPVYAVSFMALGCALCLLNLFRQGVVFDLRAVRFIVWLGVALVGVCIVDTFVPMLEYPLFTRWNADGFQTVGYIYDAGDITIGLAGMGFVLFGWIMREAILIARENEAFV